MNRKFLTAVLLLLTGCMKPLYETDVSVYRQYKYWESADRDWVDIDGFQIQIYRTQVGERTALRIVPQRDGLPSTATGYIPAAQKAGFMTATEVCGEAGAAFDPAAAPEEGRTIDRFFYQYKDASVGVTFFCRVGMPLGMDLLAEQHKWSLAQRKWDGINGVKAYVDTMPARNDGLHQIRIRLFGGTVTDNRKLARRVMLNTCPNTNFRVLSEIEGVDVVPSGRYPSAVSDENVRIYDYTCTP